MIDEYVEHYNNERPHQGIGNQRNPGTSYYLFSKGN